MIKPVFLLFVNVVLFLTATFAQSIKRDQVKVDGITLNYYSNHSNAKLNGILILLPSFGEKARHIFDETSLPEILADKGFLTIIPEINNTLFADRYAIDELDQIIKTQVVTYHIANFVIGGLSSGGAIAIGYTEYLLSKDTSIMIKGVFAVDSPLDLSRIYASAVRKINYRCHGVVMKEGISIKNEFDHIFGGSPDTQLDEYIKHSSFVANSSDGGNAKLLKHIPIRLYCEPDLDFVKRTYCEDLRYNDINAVDLESLNKYMVKIGNERSQYITTMGRGFTAGI